MNLSLVTAIHEYLDKGYFKEYIKENHLNTYMEYPTLDNNVPF